MYIDMGEAVCIYVEKDSSFKNTLLIFNFKTYKIRYKRWYLFKSTGWGDASI